MQMVRHHLHHARVMLDPTEFGDSEFLRTRACAALHAPGPKLLRGLAIETFGPWSVLVAESDPAELLNLRDAATKGDKLAPLGQELVRGAQSVRERARTRSRARACARLMTEEVKVVDRNVEQHERDHAPHRDVNRRLRVARDLPLRA